MTLGTSRLPSGASTRINVGAQGVGWCSNEAVALTGTTTETTLATIYLPGGFLGLNGEMDVHLIYTNNNNANAKTFKVNLANVGDTPTNLFTHANTTDTFDFGHIYLTNRGAVDSQLSVISDFNITPSGITTGLTFDTDAPMVLTVTGTLEDGGDTMTLEAVHVVMTYRDPAQVIGAAAG